MSARLPYLLAIVILLFLGPVAIAQQPQIGPKMSDEPVSFSAQRIEYNSRTGVYSASGDVTISQGDISIRADEAYYHPQSGRLAAVGGVVHSVGGDRLYADRFQYSFPTGQGLVLKGNLYFVDSGYFFTGERIEKLSDDEYRIINGSFTTCNCPDSCPDSPGAVVPWRLSGARIDVTIGGYAHGYDSIFYVDEIPVVYLPYAIVPAKTQRESGLLAPEMAYSARDGLVIKPKLFLTLGEHADTTLYANYLSLRGIGAGGQLRYKLSDGGHGQIEADYFKEERLYDSGERVNLKTRHLQHFGADNNYTLRANIDYVGDQTYYKDYSRDLQNLTRQWTESNVSLTGKWEDRVALAEMVFVDDLASPWVTTLQRLGRLRYSSFRRRIFGLPLVFENNLYAENMMFYDKSQYPFVDAMEEVGQRAELTPAIGLPLYLFDFLSTDLQAAWRKSLYHINEDGRWAGRGRPEFSALAQTAIFRDFGIEIDPLVKLRHVIEPVVSYDYAPQIFYGDRAEAEPTLLNPEVAGIFDRSTNAIPYLDELDRRPSLNTFTYGLNTYLIGWFIDSGSDEQSKSIPSLRELLQLQVYGGYRAGADGGPLDWTGRITGNPLQPFSLRASMRYRDSGDNRIRQYNVGGRFEFEWLGYAEVEYFEGRKEQVDYRARTEPTYEISTVYQRPKYRAISTALTATFIPRLAFYWAMDYIIPENFAASSRYGATYTSACNCWSVNVEYLDLFEVPGRRSRDEIRMLFNLIGLGATAG